MKGNVLVIFVDELRADALRMYGNSDIQMPNLDKLASNAQYWLGEISYNLGDYKKAAVAFGKGYKNYKSGNKGADSLYKLGVSMQQLGKNAEACAAYKSLPTEFPKADKELLAKSKKALTTLKCK